MKRCAADLHSALTWPEVLVGEIERLGADHTVRLILKEGGVSAKCTRLPVEGVLQRQRM